MVKYVLDNKTYKLTISEPYDIIKF